MNGLMATVLGFILIVLQGCTTAKVYNVQAKPIEKHVDSVKMVEEAIFEAGHSLGWHMQKVESGHIVGKLAIRKHMAAVDVLYNHETYSIVYKASSNLDYTMATPNREFARYQQDMRSSNEMPTPHIHKNYNGWIHNLENAIDIRLAL